MYEYMYYKTFQWNGIYIFSRFVIDNSFSSWRNIYLLAKIDNVFVTAIYS